jgi:hypothetical protein
MFWVKTIGRSLNNGVICHFTKKEAKKNIVNWKLIISFENFNEKFRRLQHFLPSTRCHNETRFLNGKCIIDKIFFMCEIMDWARKNN